MFAGSVFFGSYVGHHGCCELMNVLDNIPTRQHFMAFPPMFLIFYILSLAHSEMFPEPWQRVGDNIGVPFKVEDARYRRKSWFGNVLRWYIMAGGVMSPYLTTTGKAKKKKEIQRERGLISPLQAHPNKITSSQLVSHFSVVQELSVTPQAGNMSLENDPLVND